MSDLLREYVREVIKEEQEKIDSLKDVDTVGDLKRVVSTAISKKRSEKGKAGLKDAITGAVWDEISGKIPGLALTKSLAGALKSMYTADDTAKTGTALDYLNVDDDVSKIVDNPIENAFLKAMTTELEKLPDDTPIAEFDMTDLLSKFIAGKFNTRTISGFE